MPTTIKNLLVLIAIRDESFQGMIKAVLEGEGYEGIHLTNSENAVINLCEDYNFDIIITDLPVKGSASEANFIIKIRGMIPSLTVLFIYSNSQMKPRSAQYSMKKPFKNSEEFLLVLRHVTTEYLKRENT